MHQERRTESGASAVEFALVSTVLFLLLFGIIQYGLFFNDSLNTRQGVREAARQGVVQMPTTLATCPGSGVTWTKLSCYTKDQIGSITGTPRVHFLIPDTGGWKKPNKLIVCAAVKSDGTFGILPMPDGGVIMSKTAMSIEQDNAPPAGNPPNADTDPSGQNWSWCS